MVLDFNIAMTKIIVFNAAEGGGCLSTISPNKLITQTKLLRLGLIKFAHRRHPRPIMRKHTLGAPYGERLNIGPDKVHERNVNQGKIETTTDILLIKQKSG